ncbi:MAG: IS200/IS605 family transposase [Candidatus Cloacimonetes bacterium]|nr:IS200/IS605 family transposase [Candidatus Cloacimonadota bacterium]MCF7814005.1 IS200/IS605 family transposase [Candidatus Cloacimonadota bacterium]MCF7868633.1 IS200/IS605 family transposase [Candidatus Cloacimonadota bacterium]MCF7882862.1 IS200/IS605 family transposase [Candidatus Cloacimonadota bacterium]
MPYTQIIYHIVFATKNRCRCLEQEHRDQLFKYIAGVIKNKKCHLFRIGGVEDHIHILTSLHPTISLSNLIKDIKVSSSGFIKDQKLFPFFTNWQEGYSAFTYSNSDKSRIVKYIINQEEHHKFVSYLEELKGLYLEAGITYNERYL